MANTIVVKVVSIWIELNFQNIFLSMLDKLVATDTGCPVIFNLFEEMSLDSMNLAKSSGHSG